MRRVVDDRWSGVSPVGGARRASARRARSGITLTEILIAIMILGVGLISLATLFPIGLLRLREAARWSRSATLFETAASDSISRGLFTSKSFVQADSYNYMNNLDGWYYSRLLHNGNQVLPATFPPSYDPLIQDTAYYGHDPFESNNPGAYAGVGGTGTAPYTQPVVNQYPIVPGPGLPFAYDPLWRYYMGLYPDSQRAGNFEARFGYGLTTVRADRSGGGVVASAHGLQRLTNFHPITAASAIVPKVFVSQEDLVWQDPNVHTYTINGVSPVNNGTPVTSPSPIVPDLSAPVNAGAGVNGGSPSLDWRYSWIFTGQLSNAGNTSTFDGNIVIFENRPFGITAPANAPFAPGGHYASQHYQVDGELVVEGIFGFSTNVLPQGQTGYGANADRTVLLRWSTRMPDPVVRPGDWIADVTYERNENVVLNRFLGYNGGGQGLPNPTNSLEWDNLPAQRCFWYQVQKAVPAASDALGQAGFRSMVVYVNQSLIARTVLTAGGVPAVVNAALIAPNVVNVIPQTIFAR